jgi:diguanylate cyclase (GGDEF)-like protein
MEQKEIGGIMKQKKKNKLIMIVSAIVILSLILIIAVLNKKDNKTTLTILDKQWIAANKEKLVDIAMLNNIPVFGSEGRGVFFDFITDLERITTLEFNKVPYNEGQTPSLGEYQFKILNSNQEISKNEILIYNDEYVVVSKNKMTINDIKDISYNTIGVLNADMTNVSYYLTMGANNSYKSYDNIDLLYAGYDANEVNLIVIPYNMYLSKLITDDNYNVAMHLSDVSRKYVLALSDKNNKLNSIVKKYYLKWKNENLIKKYNQEMFNLYINSYTILDKQIKDFQSKTYTYGLVSNLPYEKVVDNELFGINSKYMKDFINYTGVELRYIEYDNIDQLQKAISDGKIDIAFDYYDISNSKTKYASILSMYKEEYVILGKNNYNIINSIKSLRNKTVNVLKDSYISKYLKSDNTINVKEYKNLSSLIDNNNSNEFIVLDKENYNYYKNSKLANYQIYYQDKLNIDYNFIIKDTNENKLFINLFNQYINSKNNEIYKIASYNSFINKPVGKTFINYVIEYFLIISTCLILFMAFSISLFKKKKATKKLKKEDKLKYSDMLTSLKNRNYLNDNIHKWDDNKIYPQALVVVDLNNIKYVNDNYGHEEGDRLIKAAASVLINTQLENTDIMRTDGNEFLIYLVGYKENQVVNYTRRLYKELKELPHGFGAALGFSMIEDDIKTIDDAINEATLDMRTNKEDNK